MECITPAWSSGKLGLKRPSLTNAPCLINTPFPETNSDMEEAGDENTLVHDEDFVCTIYHYGFVDGLDLSADVLDSLLKL